MNQPESDQIYTRGIDALRKALKPSEFIRFLRKFSSGRGDYTRDRHRILGLKHKTIDGLVAEIKKAKVKRK